MTIPAGSAYTVMMKCFLASDHVSPATGKTMAVVLSKAGGAFGNPNAGASNATEVADGWYKFALDATDTNTVGDLVVRLTAATVDDSERLLQIVNANTGGLAALPNVASGSAGAVITSGTGTAQLAVSGGAAKVDGTSALTESYGTSGSGVTLAQALYELLQNLGEFSITGTTITVYKRDGATTAETYSLDDAVTPSSRHRVT